MIPVTLTVSDTQLLITEQIAIEIVFLDPCLNSAYVWLEGTPPDDVIYVLTQYSLLAPFTFFHDAISIVTSPIAHTLCGLLTTVVTFDGSVIDTLTPDVQYDVTTRRFSVFSENEALLGKKPIVIESYLTKYPQTSITLTFNLNILSVCEDPSVFSVTPSAQTDPDFYFYRASSPVTFTFVEPVMQPDFCFIPTFSCAMAASSPRTDLCDVVDGDSVGKFDLTTLTYSFTSVDVVGFPEGVYTFEITTVFGSLSNVDTIVMRLVNPCNLSELAVVRPLKDQVYTFFQPAPTLFTYDVQKIAQPTGVEANCGNYLIEFTDATTLQPVNPDLFDDGLADTSIAILDGSEQRVFTIYQTLDPELVDNPIQIAYKITLVDYPGPAVSGSFSVKYIISAQCDDRLITEGVFESLPDYCAITEEEEEEAVVVEDTADSSETAEVEDEEPEL